MTGIELKVDNSSYFQITLTNGIDGTPENSAVVTGRVDNVDDSVLEPTFTMNYVALSDGIYRATVAPNAGMVAGLSYKVVINAEAGGLVYKSTCVVRAEKNSACED